MIDENVIKLLHKIKALVRDKCYRVKIHTVRHMIEESFSEKDKLMLSLEIVR